MAITPFFERQRGGLCRMHALNAYLAVAQPELGRPAYSEEHFKKEIASFDAQQHDRFGTSISATDYDAVFSDQRGVIAYILAKHNIYVRHVAIGSAMAHVDDAIAAGIFFVYNSNHVWVIMRGDSDATWLRVDSMSGVTIDCPSFDRTVGLLIPIKSLAAEFVKVADNLQVLTGNNISRYVYDMRDQLLGEAETLIGSAVAMLEVQLGDRDFPIVAKLIRDYYAFTRCERLDHQFVAEHLPSIVRGIYSLRRVFFASGHRRDQIDN